MDADPLEHAKKIAKDHAMFIVPCTEREPHTFPPVRYTAYLVYRKPAYKEGKPTRLGRRKDPAELLRFVKQLAHANATES